MADQIYSSLKQTLHRLWSVILLTAKVRDHSAVAIDTNMLEKLSEEVSGRNQYARASCGRVQCTDDNVWVAIAVSS